MDAHHPGRVERVDGNAAGGRLLALFGTDMTTARATCGRCDRVAELADAVAEIDDACVILLCRGCGHTLMTHLVTGGRATLSLGALTRLDWAVDAADAPEVGPAGIEPTTSTV